MNLDTFCPCHESEYIISEYRIAAPGHTIIQASDILGINDQNIVASFLLYYVSDCLFLRLGYLF